MSRLLCWLSLSLVVLAGCDDDEGPIFVELGEVGGALCIHGDGEDYTNTSYLEGTPVDVTVVLDPFVGASSVMASCSIEQDGSTLHVSATGGYWTKPPGVSTNEVRAVVADCTSEPLAAGSYTVEYAHQTTTLEVPSMGMAVELGSFDPPWSPCGF